MRANVPGQGRIFWAALAAFTFCNAAALLAQEVSPPPETGAAYMVVYFEVRQDGENATANALSAYRDATRAAPGIVDVGVFQEEGQSNRFMLTETWQDEAASDGHDNTPEKATLLRALEPLQIVPPDGRMHRAFMVDADRSEQGAGLFVMTHLDVAPPFFAPLQEPLAPYIAASRNDAGNADFSVLQAVAPRQNHLTVLEAWASREALESHRTAAHTISFREEILPILGALYDERIYRRLD
jgi:quinol monooxygenase YgiN